MTRSVVWSFIKSSTKRDPAGKQVTTSFLGWVYGRAIGGEMVAIIPVDLETEARHHGFNIVGASVQDGTYTLEKL